MSKRWNKFSRKIRFETGAISEEENACEAGKRAAASTRAWLLNNYILLDLDDKPGRIKWPMG